MKLRVPDYFDDFSCLAGACPHSCCMEWEVVLDEDTARRYRALPGPLGERLRAAMQLDGEDWCFPLRGGRCPFLNQENLCEVHLTLDEAATSVTCREHPRFFEDYGTFREVTLSASCPESNRRLLCSEAPLLFPERTDDTPAEAGDEWLTWLLPLRERMLALLQNRTCPLNARLRDILLLAQGVQERLDTEDEDALPELVEGPLPAHSAAPETTGLFPYALQFLETLEVLEPDWRDLLHQGEAAEPAPVSEALLERIAAYFLFHYILKAVNDGDVLGQTQLCIFAVLTIRRLAAVCGPAEALRRFSCEIEHDEENLSALRDGFWVQEELSPTHFYAELS